ncbi:hypothetical protein EDB86DRAFT_2827139 [Lactarius hatsudake]|nr:hypothetical protein EDB86DRAFT_2827139 [Lactarius hatsudake]
MLYIQGMRRVIVDSNGSGNTIPKLPGRIYDPTEGDSGILIDEHNIKTLGLADRRHATAIPFRDYFHVPLSVLETISPWVIPVLRTTTLRRGSHMSGRSVRIDRTSPGCPDGFDTYLERPVHDQYKSGRGNSSAGSRRAKRITRSHCRTRLYRFLTSRLATLSSPTPLPSTVAQSTHCEFISEAAPAVSSSPPAQPETIITGRHTLPKTSPASRKISDA